MGDKKLSDIAAEDIGKCAYGIFKSSDTYKDQSVGIAGGHLTGQEMADALSRALGVNVYNAVSPDTYRSFGFDGADDLGNMFRFYFNCEFVASGSIEVAKKLNPDLLSFDDWLAKNKGQIPLE